MSETFKEKAPDQFNQCCKIHDIDYELALIPRRQSDVKFLHNMKKAAKDSKKLLVVAYIFYISVRLLGWISYGKK